MATLFAAESHVTACLRGSAKYDARRNVVDDQRPTQPRRCHNYFPEMRVTTSISL